MATRLEADLALKAAADDVKQSLSLINKQLARLTAQKLNRDQIDGMLSGKVDRREIDAIARRLAGDADDRLDPTLVAKQQMPQMKCLSCDRPFKHAPRTEAGAERPPAAYEDLGPADPNAPEVEVDVPSGIEARRSWLCCGLRDDDASSLALQK